MAPRTVSRQRQGKVQTFQLSLPKGIVVRPENTICKVDMQLRLQAETGAAIRKVRSTNPDFLWEVPMNLDDVATVDRVHQPVVVAGDSPNKLVLHLQSYTKSASLEIDSLDADQLKCVVCQEYMIDPEVAVYKCRAAPHYVCEPCVLNMDAVATHSGDKCPVCRHPETFVHISNWNDISTTFTVECEFCNQLVLQPQEELEAHYAVCKSISSPSQ